MKTWLVKVIGGATFLAVLTLFLGFPYQVTRWIVAILGVVVILALFAIRQIDAGLPSIDELEKPKHEGASKIQSQVDQSTQGTITKKVVHKISYTSHVKKVLRVSQSFGARLASLIKGVSIPKISKVEKAAVIPEEVPQIEVPQEEVIETYVQEVAQRPPRPSLRDLIERGPVIEEETVEEVVAEEIEEVVEQAPPVKVIEEVLSEIHMEEPEAEDEIVDDVEPEEAHVGEVLDEDTPSSEGAEESKEEDSDIESVVINTPTGILKKRLIRKTLPQNNEEASPRVGYTKRYEVLD